MVFVFIIIIFMSYFFFHKNLMMFSGEHLFVPVCYAAMQQVATRVWCSSEIQLAFFLFFVRLLFNLSTHCIVRSVACMSVMSVQRRCIQHLSVLSAFV